VFNVQGQNHDVIKEGSITSPKRHTIIKANSRGHIMLHMQRPSSKVQCPKSRRWRVLEGMPSHHMTRRSSSREQRPSYNVKHHHEVWEKHHGHPPQDISRGASSSSKGSENQVRPTIMDTRVIRIIKSESQFNVKAT
jgi:hypothetical protein